MGVLLQKVRLKGSPLSGQDVEVDGSELKFHTTVCTMPTQTNYTLM